ncbi:MAG: diacylglycerol kinase family lipid kinase, partial [Sphingobacteriia bacterium]|nr:diacylglycerol kinase family lipid kinase [Sphingobacteriia bacterium]
MQRRILFIVNPNAGKKKSEVIIDLIHAELPSDLQHEVLIWKNKDDFSEISSRIKSRDFSDVVAAGGDGTVNRVAQELIGTGICLGIIPLGSGNGLARSLALSMNVKQCLQQIISGRSALIDSGTVNGHAFFCTAGTGFDAHIG